MAFHLQGSFKNHSGAVQAANVWNSLGPSCRLGWCNYLLQRVPDVEDSFRVAPMATNDNLVFRPSLYLAHGIGEKDACMHADLAATCGMSLFMVLERNPWKKIMTQWCMKKNHEFLIIQKFMKKIMHEFFSCAWFFFMCMIFFMNPWNFQKLGGGSGRSKGGSGRVRGGSGRSGFPASLRAVPGANAPCIGVTCVFQLHAHGGAHPNKDWAWSCSSTRWWTITCWTCEVGGLIPLFKHSLYVIKIHQKVNHISRVHLYQPFPWISKA
jgi:hypothetical protein